MHNAIDLLFDGMEKLGPGSDADTLHVLSLLPKQRFDVIVDAGCGAGRQTIALTRHLGTLVHAVDSYAPFLEALTQRAGKTGVGHLVQTHCMDMKDIPNVFQSIDLLWAEGSAYNIGFANALAAWASVLRPGRFAAVSELSWLRDRMPEEARAFFQAAYPDMRSVQDNVEVAERAGYRMLNTHTIAPEAWVVGYYDLLLPRAKALLGHVDESVRDLAAETLREIEIFERSEGSYGYVFYVVQRV